MRRFHFNQVLLLAENDVIYSFISGRESTAGNYEGEFWNSDPDFIFVFNCNCMSNCPSYTVSDIIKYKCPPKMTS
jgi:hypothetical protein